MNSGRPTSVTPALLLCVLLAAALTVALHGLAVDDAFVTYRYAANLAAGVGFVYNPGEAVLSTTAPLYAMLLSVFAWLGVDLPLASNLLGGASIGAGAATLVLWGQRRRRPHIAALAGLFYVLSPLLWLALGMETAFLLALALAAFLADELDRPGWAGALLGAAVAVRYDAALLAALIFGLRAWRQRRPSWRMAAAGLLAAAPVLLFLTITHGSPLPATLGAKQAQTGLGVSGFFAGAGYLQGLGILLQGWWAQSPLYLLTALALAAGLARALRRQHWLLPWLLWAVLHVLAYELLGVAPYFWYYAPLVPAAAWLAALGAAWLWDGARLLHQNWRPGLVLAFAAALVLAAPAVSLHGMWQALRGPLPDPQTALSKVLPEAKVDAYRRTGEWLAANTPASASVGVTEVGVMGFYSGRRMVDFLGLIQPDAAAALARGDPAWTLYAYQPDYLALIAVNPLYSVDPRADAWFQAAYWPIQRFDDPRFWGSPVVIYRRLLPAEHLSTSPPSPPSSGLPVRFGEHLWLLAVEPASAELTPGGALAVRLWWQARAALPRDYRISVQALGAYDLIVAQRDAAPAFGARPTSSWQADEVVADLALLGVPAAVCAPDSGSLHIVVYDPEGGARLPVFAADGAALGEGLRWGAFTLAAPVLLRPETGDGDPVAARFEGDLLLRSYTLAPRAVRPGEALEIVLDWQVGPGWPPGGSVFVHLIAEASGERLAQADGPPLASALDRRLLILPAHAPAGIYRPLIGAYLPETGARLPWLDAIGQPMGDAVRLCGVRVGE